MDIDWPTGIITIYKTDSFMTWAGGVIYDLNTDLFRRALKDREDDVIGMSFTDTHSHRTSVILDGIEYARIIEILTPYTITFDDTGGGWVCNLIGSNNNILTKTNLSSVQVAPHNSAGLVQMSEIQHGIFNGVVTVDEVNGFSGTAYPACTPLRPGNNLTDAKIVANYRGFTTIYVIGHLNVANVDLTGFTLKGINAANSSITLESSAVLTRCEFRDIQVSGYLDGECLLRDCYVNGVNYFSGIFHECAFTEAPVTLSGMFPAILLNCYSASYTNQSVVIDCANGAVPLIIRNWAGNIKIINRNTDGVYSSINFTGYCELDSSITAGGWDISGTGDLVNNTTGAAVVDHSKLVHGDEIASAVWGYTRSGSQPAFDDSLSFDDADNSYLIGVI
jgi:hypothetical protein